MRSLCMFNNYDPGYARELTWVSNSANLKTMGYKPVPHDHEAFLKKALKRKDFREAYEDLEEEYTLVREMLAARSRAGLTQEAVAERMGTTKSAVSRLEAAGKHAPSLTTLKKYAQAVGCHLEIKLVPDTCRTKRSARTTKKQAAG
jgi:DNA-binding XRE family transcriptional regulator